MHPIDLSIFVIYMLLMLGVGFYFLRHNKGGDDYFVGGRKMGGLHVGLSVVATDVGGGFSIGLGGLGFTMGLAGSWMLFTGLLGAWASAVLLVPKIKRHPAFDHAFTFPEFFTVFFNRRVALLAGIISAIGYIGFTSSQILAGAKLAAGTYPGLDMQTALLIMGFVAVIYTVMGGLKAVIYTDTIQWILLMGGLILVGLPFSVHAVGGFDAIVDTLEPQMLSLSNISPATAINWAVTIIPIWFVGMTLYQRIYACHDEKTAKRAWYFAGLLEWPIMAFLGVSLGLVARVAAEQGMFSEFGLTSGALPDAEAGLPMLLRTVLPVGVMGITMAAYFSAILSTADSCLMACSGNLVSDIIGHFVQLDPNSKRFLRLSQFTTLALGAVALFLASTMTNVLELMLYSYAFMVSGLFVPVLVGLFTRKTHNLAAALSMITGGCVTLVLEGTVDPLPLGLCGNLYGLTCSLLVYLLASNLLPKSKPSGSATK